MEVTSGRDWGHYEARFWEQNREAPGAGHSYKGNLLYPLDDSDNFE